MDNNNIMTSFLARQKFLDGHFRFVCTFGDVYGNAHKFCQNKFNLHLKNYYKI